MPKVALDMLVNQFINRKDVCHGKAQNIRIEPVTSSNTIALQVDGDAAQYLPADINIMPAAAQVLL
jgi:diacylglycerol kinase family enzyme